METDTLERIEERLHRLPQEKLEAVLSFVSSLEQCDDEASILELMAAAEVALRETWDTPEEDEAWSHL